MSTLTMTEVVRMALFCCLLGPTLGLSNLRVLDSGRARRGLLGTGGGLFGGGLGGGVTGGGGGVAGGVLGGGGTGGGGGVLDGVLGGGDKGLLGGVLGGDGGKVGGLLGGVGGLLNNATNAALPGTGRLLNGDLDQTQLLNLLMSQNGLLGLTDVLGKGPQEPFQWYNILNLEFIRGSWKVIHGTELILNLQTRIILKFPGILLRTVIVDVDITLNLAITQDKPGDLKLVLKNCPKLVAGFAIKLPPGLLALLISNVVNSAIKDTLPSMLCPIFQGWFNFVNEQLHTLNNVFFGLLGKIHTALSTMPISSGHFTELDFKDKPFPGFLLNWLFSKAKVNPKIDGGVTARHR
ncbi:BPI fold-containing family B member 4-like isoform X1 [Erythrolamprus reginae]|uniref:BPI fold-containing family B member 4-like isoform X1 n=1 Tax=Erythrolamprus reginae TaxID=121349 RepID=UPI00396C591E